jgi:hypothetical protein
MERRKISFFSGNFPNTALVVSRIACCSFVSRRCNKGFGLPANAAAHSLKGHL